MLHLALRALQSVHICSKKETKLTSGSQGLVQPQLIGLPAGGSLPSELSTTCHSTHGTQKRNEKVVELPAGVGEIEKHCVVRKVEKFEAKVTLRDI